VVADIGWRSMLLTVQVRNGDPYHSDHRPVVVVTEKGSIWRWGSTF
jgi:hypothetical protein